MLKITSADPAIESIYGSPARSRERDSFTNSDRYASRVVIGSYTSPSNKQKIGGIVIPGNTSTNSSPNSDRLRVIRESPSWRPAEEDDEVFKHNSSYESRPFVKRTGNEADDVFGSPGHGGESTVQGRLLCPFTSSKSR